MKTVSLKLLTIIADEALQRRLIEDVKTLGARGYTLEKAYGEGDSGGRISPWEGENIRLELLISAELAEKILDRLARDYFDKYSIIAYLSDVQVLRGEKFI
ncbi:MAG: transcriptional regulator [[Chlorobium] sp. 445]|nr:MAG: transcriptional regulator [[Chlorobium] sp. 445]